MTKPILAVLPGAQGINRADRRRDLAKTLLQTSRTMDADLKLIDYQCARDPCPTVSEMGNRAHDGLQALLPAADRLIVFAISLGGGAVVQALPRLTQAATKTGTRLHVILACPMFNPLDYAVRVGLGENLRQLRDGQRATVAIPIMGRVPDTFVATPAHLADRFYDLFSHNTHLATATRDRTAWLEDFGGDAPTSLTVFSACKDAAVPPADCRALNNFTPAGIRYYTQWPGGHEDEWPKRIANAGSHATQYLVGRPKVA